MTFTYQIVGDEQIESKKPDAWINKERFDILKCFKNSNASKGGTEYHLPKKRISSFLGGK